MKFTGNTQPAVSPRLEDIEQMTVQTDQLDLNSGFGQASTQINFVSRRGTNQFHGRAYEDFRNSGLNANSWTNDVNGLRKNKLIMNDFGGSVGGPIFSTTSCFSSALSRCAGSREALRSPTICSPQQAQSGDFTYVGTDGAKRTRPTCCRSRSRAIPTFRRENQRLDCGSIRNHQYGGQIGLRDADVENALISTRSPGFRTLPPRTTIRGGTPGLQPFSKGKDVSVLVDDGATTASSNSVGFPRVRISPIRSLETRAKISPDRTASISPSRRRSLISSRQDSCITLRFTPTTRRRFISSSLRWRGIIPARAGSCRASSITCPSARTIPSSTSLIR